MIRIALVAIGLSTLAGVIFCFWSSYTDPLETFGYLAGRNPLVMLFCLIWFGFFFVIVFADALPTWHRNKSRR